MKRIRFILYSILSLLLAACNEPSSGDLGIASGSIIQVGASYSEGTTLSVTQTRANETTKVLRAEDVEWMKGALRHGLDITYSNLNSDGSHCIENEKVAILKWLGTKGTEYNGEIRGDYSFIYKGSVDNKALWYDNGLHYFEGQYVPDIIRNGNGKTMSITGFTTNQKDDTDYTYDATGVASGSIGNYTLLSHYVGMPPKWTASATVDQILLPFKHRLARVIAYILIDPLLVDNQHQTAILKGYNLENEKDDPSTTELRFANVDVLKYVTETAATDGAHSVTLTPEWEKARRVIPHFVGEFHESQNTNGESSVPTTAAQNYKDAAHDGGFIVYTHKRTEKKIYPRDNDWFTAHKDYVDKGTGSAYTQQCYAKVPVYDVIVRPTYASPDDVMYDEAGYYQANKTPDETAINTLASKKNQIEFEMMLNNDLVYTKVFEFDLNANQQTVVYISIDRESVDYDESKPETWTPFTGTDDYYGVNNDLGHSLSIAGSSWQRAFSNGAFNGNVTDGNKYDNCEDGDGNGQYLSDENWIAFFKQATVGGSKQGYYFILDHDITISDLPDNFVFAGHLDARKHKITISGRNYLFDGLNGIYDGTAGQYNLYTENGKIVPVKGYRAELLNLKVEGGDLFPAYALFCGTNLDLTGATVTGYIYNCYDQSHSTTPIANTVPIPQY